MRVKFQGVPTNVLKLVERAHLLPVDFCSGLGIVFQSVFWDFILAGDRWVARAKSTHCALTPEVGHGEFIALHAS